MYRIRRFGVMKTSTIVAAMYLTVAFVIGLPIALIVAVAGTSTGAAGQGTGAALGIVLVVVLLGLFYAVIGWIFTAIACVLYNIVAGWVGGIEIQLEAVAPPPPVPTWGVQEPQVPPSAPPAIG